VRFYPFIEAEKSQHGNVKRACELLEVSRSAYYAAREGSPSQRAAEDAELAARIEAVDEESRGRYGAPRVHAQLRAEGRRHSRKRVARLMRDQGLRGRAGQCWDNALAESFFSSLKGELAGTRAGARRAVAEYTAWCNGTRLHSSPGCQSRGDNEGNHRENNKRVAGHGCTPVRATQSGGRGGSVAAALGCGR
jgi:hypothetical protein